jgi:hypothetical protein
MYFRECEDRALHWAAQQSVSIICPKQNESIADLLTQFFYALGHLNL